ncbi:MAG TPA: helix-turn-helix domain-containing protein [Caulobacteraceae bacterium]|jgi:AcrR family transcriptional regulator
MAAIRLTRQELYERVWAQPMAGAARALGLSPNGLAKICDRLLTPYPGRGYWARAARAAPPPLPPAPELDAVPIVIGDDRVASRRPRTRLSPAARREQLLSVAREIVVREGVAALSLRRVGRDAGVSEALAFGYFSSRAEILAELARRELAAVAEDRSAEIALGRSPRDRIARSIVAYLRQIEARGGVLQALLTAPEVRTLLRGERQSRRALNTAAVSARFAEGQGVAPDFARGATAALSAASRRAGALIASGHTTRAEVEPLVLAMVEGANRALAGRPVSSRR